MDWNATLIFCVLTVFKTQASDSSLFGYLSENIMTASTFIQKLLAALRREVNPHNPAHCF